MSGRLVFLVIGDLDVIRVLATIEQLNAVDIAVETRSLQLFFLLVNEVAELISHLLHVFDFLPVLRLREPLVVQIVVLFIFAAEATTVPRKTDALANDATFAA